MASLKLKAGKTFHDEYGEDRTSIHAIIGNVSFDTNGIKNMIINVDYYASKAARTAGGRELQESVISIDDDDVNALFMTMSNPSSVMFIKEFEDIFYPYLLTLSDFIEDFEIDLT